MATYRSVKVNLAVTGLPVVITGEVMVDSSTRIIIIFINNNYSIYFY